METPEELITDQMLDSVWGNANFGNIPKREVLRNSLLKYACGFETGNTAKSILRELDFITPHKCLTPSGKQYLFSAYSGGQSV